MCNVLSALVLVLGVASMFLEKAQSCGGYDLEIDYMRNCDSNNVIELSNNFSVSLSKDCMLEFNGCVIAHEDITSAEVEYTVHKDGVSRSGKKDGCQQMGDKVQDFEIAVELLGLPQHCPVKKNTLCLNKKSVDVSKYKLRMNLLMGHISGKSMMTSDGGGKTCTEFSAHVVNRVAKAIPGRHYIPVIG
ncbi:uncharacterized protein LOC126846245 [Adelges cooleyi]|uniref:uncharacterized protein LOC126846245 n=1 Tax=Adelges cooleyi TaxID=133065 RepID=UPI0021801662|nr:uncharacterized protein LOC126846245 [Adelges cooleyi]